MSQTPLARALPSGFVGVSFEFRGLEEYAGSNPSALNPVFLQLIRNLAPGQRPVIRIGGDSTDWTWWPVPHLSSPGGVHYGLDAGFGQVARALARALNAHLILGVNFEADSQRIAAREANMLTRTIGASSISALELGNEPDLYSTYSWYHTPSGEKVFGRPLSYGPSDYLSDFAHIASALGTTTLAGPASGSPPYLAMLGTYLARNPRVRLATIHAYPLAHCNPAEIPTIAELLAPQTVATLAANASAAVAVAHRHGVAMRVAELNAVTCGGYKPVTASFGAALWALEQLFALDRVGVDGVNMHTIPNTTQHLLYTAKIHGHWIGTVLPEYYGLMAFTQVAPAGSRLLPVSGAIPSPVQVDATVLHGNVRMALINPASTPRWLTLRVPGVRGPLISRLLSAPSLAAQQGVSLGGQTINPLTGALTGTARVGVLRAAHGAYRIRVPATSALLLQPF